MAWTRPYVHATWCALTCTLPLTCSTLTSTVHHHSLVNTLRPLQAPPTLMSWPSAQ